MIGSEQVKYIIFIAVLLNTAFLITGGEIMLYDKDVALVFDQLDCAVLLSEINEDKYGDYSVVEKSKLLKVQSWQFEDKQIELLKGKKDYIAIMRDEDKVYCAQYINGYNLDEICEEKRYIEPFLHKNEICGNGMYVRTEIAFFLDGETIYNVYFNPTNKEPNYTDNPKENLLSLVL